MTTIAPQSFARIANVKVAETFSSSIDNVFSADIEVENASEHHHSSQVVFRGYVRRNEELLYEFFHEQVWFLIEPHSNKSYQAAVDVWLPRFPPSMTVNHDCQIEYSVRATIDPWFSNTHVEKIFAVRRDLVLKMPHDACYTRTKVVNECVGHGGLFHKQCKPLNGELSVNKAAFTHNEEIVASWKLKYESAVEKVAVLLQQTMEFRNSEPGHHMRCDKTVKTIASKELEHSKEEGHCELKVTPHIPVTMSMTLWNVVSVAYVLIIQVRVAGHKESIDLNVPIIVVSEQVQGRIRKRGHDASEHIFKRALDIDDDSADDDDYDSEIENEEDRPDEQPKNRQYSVDVEKLQVVSPKEDSIADSYALVTFEVNSNVPRPLKSLRLLLQGEVRAGTTWFAFLRYKAILTTDPRSAFSPGTHNIKIALPFADSQYDTAILAPSFKEDIRYIVRVTTDSWRKNYVNHESDLKVTRSVDTWSKKEYQGHYNAEMGVNTIYMRQRCFQRGKYAFVAVRGPKRRVVLEIHQQRMLRQPGLRKDETYCSERLVSTNDSTEDQTTWPEDFFVPIPEAVTPSIEICYWNVLVLGYTLNVNITLEDGHVHNQQIPIWIGNTDDKLSPPKAAPVFAPAPTNPANPTQQAHKKPSTPIVEEELPEFEVVETGDTQYQPEWVERYNNNTYGVD